MFISLLRPLLEDLCEISQHRAAPAAGLRVAVCEDMSVVTIDKENKFLSLPQSNCFRHWNNADLLTLHENQLIAIKLPQMSVQQTLRGIVDFSLRKANHRIEPWLSIIQGNTSRSTSDQLVRKSCTLNNVVQLVVDPVDCQLDIELQFSSSLADVTPHLAVSITSEADFASTSMAKWARFSTWTMVVVVVMVMVPVTMVMVVMVIVVVIVMHHLSPPFPTTSSTTQPSSPTAGMATAVPTATTLVTRLHTLSMGDRDVPGFILKRRWLLDLNVPRHGGRSIVRTIQWT